MNAKKRRLPRLLIVGVILLAALSVSALAYLSASTVGLVNTFEPATETDPGILEGSDGNTFDGITKEQVKVNVGNPGYAVYVRAAIVFNWEMDGDGNENHFHATAPVAGTDYILSINADWFLGTDGFYYHKAMVNSGGTTEALINSCQLKDGAVVPGGYHLDVKIIAQTIQALGTTDADDTPAVTAAWGVKVDSATKQLTDSTT